MNQLQLYITTTASGYNKKLEINPEPEVLCHVTDLTDAIDLVSYIPQEKHVFYVLKYIEQGVFIVIIRTIPDQQGDHLAAWIFVPAGIEIKGNDLTGIVDGVKRLVTNSKITGEDLSRLRLLFGKTFPENESRDAILGNYGNAYAHRFYGADTGYRLTDLIGNMRYQLSYLPYAGVIIADKDDVNAVEGEDLTRCPLRVAEPPAAELPEPEAPEDSVAAEPESAYGAPQEKPQEAAQADLPAEAPAHEIPEEPITEPTEQPAPEPTEQPAPEPSEEPAPKQISNQHSLSTAEESESSTDPQPMTKDISSLLDREKTYVFEIPAKSASIGSVIRFEIHTKNQLADSPIEGYELSDIMMEGTNHTNHLVSIRDDAKRSRLIWGACGIIIGIVLCLLANWIFSGADIKDVTKELSGTPTALLPDVADEGAPVPAPVPAVNESLEEALAYLDSTKAWNRNRMEQYSALQGLFDDMNNYNLQAIVTDWAQKLAGSKNFADLVKFSNNSIRGKKLKRDKITAPYNKNPQDSMINIKAYANKIDR